MTELTVNFGDGEIKFRDETWGGMVALLSQMLDCVRPTGAIACRIEEVDSEDWYGRADFAMKSMKPQADLDPEFSENEEEEFPEEPWNPDPL